MSDKEPNNDEVIRLVTDALLGTREYVMTDLIFKRKYPRFSAKGFKDQYALIRDGMTVHEFITVGGSQMYLRHLEVKECVEVDIPF